MFEVKAKRKSYMHQKVVHSHSCLKLSIVKLVQVIVKEAICKFPDYNVVYIQ